MSEEKKYNPEDTVMFVSILDEEWTGRFDGKDYLIPARATRPFRIAVAQHFAKHMADVILQREYDAEAKKSGDKERRARARLWIDPRRFDLYKEMIPELAEVAETVEVAAKEELKKRPPARIHADK